MSIPSPNTPPLDEEDEISEVYFETPPRDIIEMRIEKCITILEDALEMDDVGNILKQIKKACSKIENILD